MSNENTDIVTIETTDLDNVTGGVGAGGWWGTALSAVSSLFGGGTNIGIQNGTNQRQATGNTGPVSMGDNSPITTAPSAPAGADQ